MSPYSAVYSLIRPQRTSRKDYLETLARCCLVQWSPNFREDSSAVTIVSSQIHVASYKYSGEFLYEAMFCFIDFRLCSYLQKRLYRLA